VRQLSSMIAFTVKGAKYLMANKVEGSILLLKQILNWLKGQDKRFPRKPALISAATMEMDPGEARRFIDLAARVLKPI